MAVGTIDVVINVYNSMIGTLPYMNAADAALFRLVDKVCRAKTERELNRCTETELRGTLKKNSRTSQQAVEISLYQGSK